MLKNVGGERLTMTRAPLTAAEILQHPEFKTAIWDLKPAKKGKVLVGEGRRSPCQIAYEVHGSGPLHLVVRPFPDVSYS